MKNIAILTGGDSEERVISLKSGRVVFDHLPKDRYRCFLIDIQKADWKDVDSGVQVDKNDFSLSLNGEKIRFDGAFAALHGSPLEDSKMQGYLELQGIPYTCCSGINQCSLYDFLETNVPLCRVRIKVNMAEF